VTVGGASGAYDVAVIGAGVVGAAVAWRLSREPLRVVWLEAAHDVAEGTSKANSAIATTGYELDPGSLEARLLRSAAAGWEALAEQLDVPYRRIGAVALAFTPEEESRIAELAALAGANAVEAEVVGPDELVRLCPAASPDALAGLHVAAEGIVDPLRLTTAFAEVAVRGGVDLRCSTPVTGFRHAGEAISQVVTPRGTFAVGAVVNAAGLAAGEIAGLAGAEEVRISPRKGEFLVIDREVGRLLTKVVTPVPTSRTRGILVVPTTGGSLLVGPTAEDVDDPGDLATEGRTLARVLREAKRLVPAIEPRHAIKAFAGLRPAADPPYRIERSSSVPNFVQAAGLRSTGVSSSPAVAELVRDLLEGAGVARRELGPARRLPAVPRLIDLADDEAATLAVREPGYRTIVCACEHVSAAELDAALQGAVPARCVDGVRKRTRAGGGRCQGTYCGAGIGFLLSMRHGLAPKDLRQGAPGTEWGSRAT
jgi:glycerol-3-phosphate dehydrogenase